MTIQQLSSMKKRDSSSQLRLIMLPRRTGAGNQLFAIIPAQAFRGSEDYLAPFYRRAALEALEARDVRGGFRALESPPRLENQYRLYRG